MNRIKRSLLGVAAALVVLPIGLPVAAQPSSGGGIGGRTTQVDPNNPRTQSIFIHEINRGKSASDKVLVINRTDKERTIELKSVDGITTNTGAYACRENAEEVKGSGAWVKLAKTELTLPAGGEEAVDFTIEVPANADVGEHNGCITFRDVEPEVKSEGGVVLRMRQAIRTVITVPGKKQRNLGIKSLKQIDNPKDESSQDQHFEMQISNQGNVSADVDAQIKIKNLFGFKVAGNGGEYVVVPDNTLTQNFKTELRPIFGGWYRVESSLRYDKRLGVFGTKDKNAEFEEKSGPSLTIFIWPTALGWALIFLILLTIGVLVWWLINKRNKEKLANRHVARYVVRKGDTLVGLSERAGYDWKTIARMNGLKPPYALREGQSLRVPISDDKIRQLRQRSAERRGSKNA